jgi:hypothetical protein
MKIAMVPMLLRFVAGARAAGLRISTSEVLDCLQHLKWVDPLEELQFKSVLQTNFAKSRREKDSGGNTGAQPPAHLAQPGSPEFLVYRRQRNAGL